MSGRDITLHNDGTWTEKGGPGGGAALVVVCIVVSAFYEIELDVPAIFAFLNAILALIPTVIIGIIGLAARWTKSGLIFSMIATFIISFVLLSFLVQLTEKRHRPVNNPAPVSNVQTPPTAQPPADIFAAAARGTVSEIERFIRNGVSVNVKDRYDWTPLHAAAQTNSAEVLRYLISQGADVHARDSMGRTPLDMTRGLGEQAAILRTAMQGGDSPVFQPPMADPAPQIFDVAAKGTVQDVERFIKTGISVNAKDDRGWTPLHYAAERNPNLDVLKYLIAQGADVHAKSNMEFIPLDFANTEEKKHVLREAMECALSSQTNEPSRINEVDDSVRDVPKRDVQGAIDVGTFRNFAEFTRSALLLRNRDTIWFYDFPYSTAGRQFDRDISRVMLRISALRIDQNFRFSASNAGGVSLPAELDVVGTVAAEEQNRILALSLSGGNDGIGTLARGGGERGVYRVRVWFEKVQNNNDLFFADVLKTEVIKIQ